MNRRGRSHCRFCEQSLSHVVADLGMSPLCEDCLADEIMKFMCLICDSGAKFVVPIPELKVYS
jgi:hypothetical protein